MLHPPWDSQINELSRTSGPSDVRRGPRERSRGGRSTGWWSGWGCGMYRWKADRSWDLGWGHSAAGKMRFRKLLGLRKFRLRTEPALTPGLVTHTTGTRQRDVNWTMEKAGLQDEMWKRLWEQKEATQQSVQRPEGSQRPLDSSRCRAKGPRGNQEASIRVKTEEEFLNEAAQLAVRQLGQPDPAPS